MPRPALEAADIFRDHGAPWRAANAGHVSLGQLKVMSAIEDCRTAALGGHVVRCENAACGYTAIAYNSCRNRHCPKCQGAAAREWLGEREAELLPVPYFHVVFSLPARVADIAYQNKAAIYDILFKASAEAIAHRRCRTQSGSIPHDAGPAHQHPQRSTSSFPALRQQCRLPIRANIVRNERSKTLRSTAKCARRSTRPQPRCFHLGRIEDAADAPRYIPASARVKIPIVPPA